MKLNTKRPRVASTPSPRWAPGELIVGVKEGVELREVSGRKVLETFEFSEGTELSQAGEILRLKLGKGEEVSEALRSLLENPDVAFAEPNYIYSLQEQDAQPNDLDPKLWGLHNEGQTGGTPGADIRAKEAWGIEIGDASPQGPLISVLDSGVDYTHPDLQANIWVNPDEIPGDGVDNDGNGVIDDVHGYNAYADNGDPMDGFGHGTHCAGTIAAVGDNAQGITGVMQKARVLPIKIFSDSGQTNTAVILRALEYSAKMGAQVTSNSWGGGSFSQALYQAFEAHSGLHVVAAGNRGTDNDQNEEYPANYDLDRIVAVAATDHHDKRARFSQYGEKNVDVAAPGQQIFSTLPGGKYGMKSGTSMACPHVTGAAGLILSAYPDASPEELKARLIYGSDRKESLAEVSVSKGRLNLVNSLQDDRVSPGAPNDFQMDAHIAGGQLSWTTVGDDKWANGTPRTVEVWESETALIADKLREASRTVLDAEPEVGDLATLAVNLKPSLEPRERHFAMRSVDEVGNASELRFAKVTIPAAELVLDEDFETQDTALQASGDFHRASENERGFVYSSRPGESGSVPISRLESQSLDLSQKDRAFLRFEYRNDMGHSGKPSLQVSTDGEEWTTLKPLRKRSQWRTELIDLSEYAGESLQIRFEAEARLGSRNGGLKIDGVQLLVDPE